MGIGSFFAALFQKEENEKRKIRELNIDPKHKGIASEEPGSFSVKKESAPCKKEEAPVTKDLSKAVKRDASLNEEEKPIRKDASLIKEGNMAKKDVSKSQKKAEPDQIQENPEKRERKEYLQAKKDLYHYINQTMRQLFRADQEDSWGELEPLTAPKENAAAALDRIKAEIPEGLWNLLSPFTMEENMKDPSALRQAFLSMLLPFYPAYRQYFAEFNYNTFLNRDALELFRRLTGRKFRLGYKNRYEDGSPAFEWKGNSYKVYDSKGVLLCDAIFENGVVKDGYAVLPADECCDSDWTLLRKGTFKDGQFIDGALEYAYMKPVDL